MAVIAIPSIAVRGLLGNAACTMSVITGTRKCGSSRTTAGRMAASTTTTNDRIILCDAKFRASRKFAANDSCRGAVASKSRKGR